MSVTHSTKTKKGNTRVTGKEQFYTPPATALDVMANVLAIVPDLKERTVLEPAGGSGSFLEAARNFGVTNFVSFDIEPLHPLVQRADFLGQTLSFRDAVTVSNPPFGRNNALSIPFFNHAATASEFVVFIVPRSWRKWSVQNKLDRRFHLVRDDDLCIDYVDAHGELVTDKNNLRTCVQYWKRQSSLRDLTFVQDRGLIERCSVADADVSLTIFGFGCGTLKTEFPRQPNTTQMFLKLKDPRALEALRSVDFSRFFLHTAYTEALSIKEINYLLNEHIFGDPYVLTEKPTK
jgi:predicted RNA methylase